MYVIYRCFLFVDCIIILLICLSKTPKAYIGWDNVLPDSYWDNCFIQQMYQEQIIWIEY